jgi:glycerol uptake facilitator protein/aquaporin Z
MTERHLTVHWQAWACELLATLILLFVAVTLARWLFDPSSAAAGAIQGLGWRLIIVGAVIGGVVSLLIVSPLGRRSGGHMNPAMTLAFTTIKTLPRVDAGGYIAAQMLGSIAGTTLAGVIWGPAVARPPVSFGVIQPGLGRSTIDVFVVEMLSLILLFAVTSAFLARPGLARWTPWVAGVIVGLLIATTGATTGGSFNPARAFGPALASKQTALLWSCYLLAPMIGALVVAGLISRLQAPKVLTCQLCGTPSTSPRPQHAEGSDLVTILPTGGLQHGGC